MGSDKFVQAHGRQRMDEEMGFLHKIPEIEDVQCAWILLSYSAVPRANHIVRVLPPALSHDYAALHDQAIWECFCKLLGTENLMADQLARQVATLPARCGGLGLRDAGRTADGAYWASWVDALPVLTKKLPGVAAAIVASLEREADPAPLACMKELKRCSSRLLADGARDLPTWR